MASFFTRRWALRGCLGVLVGLTVGACSAGPPSQSPPPTGRTTPSTATGTASAQGGTITLKLPEQVTSRSGDPIRIPANPIVVPSLAAEPRIVLAPDTFLDFEPSALNASASGQDNGYGDTAPEAIFSWNMRTNAVKPLWQTDPGTQDGQFVRDGNWVVAVRVGYVLPFASWKLMMHNVVTGDERVIAQNDPSLVKPGSLPPGLPVGAPVGLAPAPSVLGGHVAWVEWYRSGDGNIHKRVRLYTMSTGRTETLADISDPTKEDIRAVSLGGDRIAWYHSTNGSPTGFMVIRQLDGSGERQFQIPDEVVNAQLSGNGRYLVWMSGQSEGHEMFALDTIQNTLVKFGEHYGERLEVTGQIVGWTTQNRPTAQPQDARPGYYNLDTGVLRLLDTEAPMTSDMLSGKWLVIDYETQTLSEGVLMPVT